MPIVSRRIQAFLPHNWLELKGLLRIYVVLFYVTLGIGIYAFGCWIQTFWTDPAQLAVQSAPLRKIYLLATLQAGLACTAEFLLISLCRSLQKVLCQLSNK